MLCRLHSTRISSTSCRLCSSCSHMLQHSYTCSVSAHHTTFLPSAPIIRCCWGIDEAVDVVSVASIFLGVNMEVAVVLLRVGGWGCWVWHAVAFVNEAGSHWGCTHSLRPERRSHHTGITSDSGTNHIRVYRHLSNQHPLDLNFMPLSPNKAG